MIEVPATRDKQDIPKLGALIGKANADPVTIDGAQYPPGSLCFCGFESRGVGGQKYAGVLKFEPLPPGGEHGNKCLFKELLAVAQPEDKPAARRKRGE